MKLLLFITLFCAGGAPALSQAPPGAAAGLESITPGEILAHISFLASDSLSGRATGSAGNTAAARYVAGEFARLGLLPLLPSPRGIVSPAGEDQSTIQMLEPPRPQTPAERELQIDRYLQKFVVKRSKLSESQGLELFLPATAGGVTYRYAYRSDYLVQFSGPPRSVVIAAPVVFAGYGIDEGEDEYNDYRNADGEPLDVRGKIVLVADGFPRETDPASAFSRARKPLYRNPLRKAEAAARKGALALIVAPSPLKVEPPFSAKYEQLSRAFLREVDHLPERASSAIPILYVGANVVADLLQGTGERLDSTLTLIGRSLRGRSFPLSGRQVKIDIGVRSEAIIAQNVAGFLPGADSTLKDELVIVGAHYDHVGLGARGAMNRADSGKIHYGADDNASGTAGLLEIAEAMALRGPKRSVLFLAFGAEENGLLGSRYYVTVQPLRPLESTVAMLNCDMIGRNEPEILYIGGAFYGDDLRLAIEEANREAGTKFELLYNVGLLTSASDQAPFLRRSIPAAFFFSGLHEDYHTPADVPSKIDAEKGARVARLAYLTAWNLGNAAAPPRFRELTAEERATLSRESKATLDRIRPPGGKGPETR